MIRAKRAFPKGHQGGGQWTKGGANPATKKSAAKPDEPHQAQSDPAPQYSAGDKEKFYALKTQWAKINNDLLDHQDDPNGAESTKLCLQLKDLVKQMYRLNADPGGTKGVGLPGGARDITIVGAGPGGLATAVMGGTDGLDTLVIDAQENPGGQAKYSSRIENYPGFPVGVTGQKLVGNMFDQAERVGAETMLGVKVTGLTYDPQTGLKTLSLSNGKKVVSRAVVIAGGVQFRRMDFPGSSSPDVVVGDGEKLSKIGKGKSVVVVGGSNGAAQAALGCAKSASRVYLLSRGPISKGMSDYQVSALRSARNITAIENAEVAKLEGGYVYTKDGRKIPCNALGLFIGGLPDTGWLPKEIKLNNGRVAVDDQLQTSIPGVFAIGDIRDGGLGRIGAAVGEGQMSERNVFQYFGKLKAQENANR